MIEDYKGVWVVAELEDTKIKNVTFELLSKALELAKDLNEPVSCVLIGNDVKKHIEAVGKYAAKVYVADHPELGTYNTESYANIMIEFIKKYKPSIVLFPATKQGRDLAPRVSVMVGTGLTADCTGLEIRDNQLVQIRPAYGGNIMAEIVTPNHRPQMATVRPNVFKRIEPEPTSGGPEVIEFSLTPELLKLRAIVKEIIKVPILGKKKLDEADIIVSLGRGVGTTKESFKDIEEFANLIGAAIGCSRVLVDLGLMPKSAQVGQSGITVSPKLYVACGISGTIQHIVGMKESKMIIAINKDPNAPIFDISDFGIVGDVHKVIPILTQELKRVLKK